ncbi:MAG TPA: DsbA family protein [Dehalococcoidia bacterium]|nr:DsbA family protein [Dehalococcoidia bacterium]
MTTLPLNLVVPVGPHDHSMGAASARVTIVEYGDYQCPFCKAAEPLVAGLMMALGENLRFVFRHFPVTSVHPQAEQAAEAAEAAGAQGKFWQMHALLFANQQALDAASLRGLAHGLELDETRFEQELEDRAHSRRVRDDLTGGLRSGVRGTPTFFIDGARFDAPPSLRSILQVVAQHHPDLSIPLPAAAADVHVNGATQG